VVEAGAARVSQLDLSTGQLRVVAAQLALGLPGVAGFPPTFVFNGIAVDGQGNAYVTGDVDNVVYLIARAQLERTPASLALP
jgi:hypothetical protein